MKKKILIAVVVFIAAILGIIFYAISPSGDIEDYAAFYTDNTSSPSNGRVKVTFFGVSTLEYV